MQHTRMHLQRIHTRRGTLATFYSSAPAPFLLMMHYAFEAYFLLRKQIHEQCAGRHTQLYWSMR